MKNYKFCIDIFLCNAIIIKNYSVYRKLIQGHVLGPKPQSILKAAVIWQSHSHSSLLDLVMYSIKHHGIFLSNAWRGGI